MNYSISLQNYLKHMDNQFNKILFSEINKQIRKQKNIVITGRQKAVGYMI